MQNFGSMWLAKGVTVQPFEGWDHPPPPLNPFRVNQVYERGTLLTPTSLGNDHLSLLSLLLLQGVQLFQGLQGVQRDQEKEIPCSFLLNHLSFKNILVYKYLFVCLLHCNKLKFKNLVTFFNIWNINIKVNLFPGFSYLR